MADQRLGINAGQFFFTDRESDGWNVFRLDPLIAELPIERNIGIAIDGGHNRGALAFAGKALHARHNALPIGMAEGRVFFHDIGIRDALAVQEGAQNAIGGARIDIIGAEQRNAARLTTILRHQIFNRRNRLLVRRRAGVEDVLRLLLTFILHRVEQQTVQFFKHGQHGFAADRGPAAEGHIHLRHLQQFARLFSKKWPIGSGVHHHGFHTAPEQAAAAVDAFDHHQHGIAQRSFADGHGAGKGVQNADLDGGCLRGSAMDRWGCQSRAHAEQCRAAREAVAENICHR